MATHTPSRWLIDWSSIHNNEYPLAVTILSFIIIFFAWYQLVMKKSTRNMKPPLPPGPRGLPIVGSLPFLDPNLHIYLAKLSNTYGPIVKLRLGSKLCVVLSSPSVVEEVHKFHDVIFSNRDPTAVGLALTYGGRDIGYTPYGEQWRMLRKICVKELLTSKSLHHLQDHRRKVVREMVNNIYSNVQNPVNLRVCMVVVMFNLLTTILWGSTLGKVNRDWITVEFGDLMHQLDFLLGAPNVSDFFPILAKFDLQGLEGKLKKVHVCLDRMLDNVINERLRSKREGKVNSNSEEKDFLEILLQIKDEGGENSPFTMIHVKSLLIDMLLGGNNAILTAVEWTMAELMNHPQMIKSVQDEIKEVVGMDNIVEESHIPKFEYLNAVVKESLRLHPPGPLAIPRLTSEPCVVGGYSIPKGAKIIVNVWAIQRDAAHWDNPLEFKPERFLNAGNNYHYNGVNSSYIPFGFGRRICVGVPLVERLVPYTIASLLHSFDWRMPDGEELDLSETLVGIELTKTIPLIAVLKPRLSESKLYT